MYQNQNDGQDGFDENRYLKRFEQEFHKIMDEIAGYAVALPQVKSENESLRERLGNIRGWAEAASKIRYLKDSDADAVLANLITQILVECDNLDELKPVIPVAEVKTVSDELFEMLSKSRKVEMDEAFEGFDFFENNPYKKAAEKKIAKIKKRKGK